MYSDLHLVYTDFMRCFLLINVMKCLQRLRFVYFVFVIVSYKGKSFQQVKFLVIGGCCVHQLCYCLCELSVVSHF